MINNFLTKTTAGLYCIAGDFYLDPKRAVQVAMISHAHSDHAVPTKGKVYCTKPTRSFMEHRMFGKSFPDFSNVKFGETFKVNDVAITYYPAGHILGSAQILMEYKGERYLYTGDFKTQSDDSCEAFEYVECNHLITETTFASPEYQHPDPVEELQNLMNEKRNVVIGAYALGKAQRLTQLLTTHCKGRKVYIHPDLVAYHAMYADHGVSLGEWFHYRRDDFENGSPSFYIVPPAKFKSYGRSLNALKVFATGWKQSFYSCDRVLQVSDHADWPGVIELISKTKAQKIYTVHGNGNPLKQFFKDKIEVNIIG